MIHLCKCIPALFSVPPPIQLHYSYWTVPFWTALFLVIKRTENFVLRTWDRIGPRICTTGAESKAACITQGINKDCPPTCWFVSLGFTNRVSKDHRGKVENITINYKRKTSSYWLTCCTLSQQVRWASIIQPRVFSPLPPLKLKTICHPFVNVYHNPECRQWWLLPAGLLPTFFGHDSVLIDFWSSSVNWKFEGKCPHGGGSFVEWNPWNQDDMWGSWTLLATTDCACVVVVIIIFVLGLSSFLLITSLCFLFFLQKLCNFLSVPRRRNICL